PFVVPDQKAQGEKHAADRHTREEKQNQLPRRESALGSLRHVISSQLSAVSFQRTPSSVATKNRRKSRVESRKPGRLHPSLFTLYTLPFTLHPFFPSSPATKSTGKGKTIVVFFSAPISTSV